MKKILALAAVLVATISFGASANQANSHISHASSGTTTAMQNELNDSMAKMHENMAKSMSIEDADAAFAEGMIAHHLGAIDMAKIELKYGKNPEMRELAQAIINAQGPEIEQMQKWLEKNKDKK
ncbi:DUF305 domain-containing protein [Xenorhabdus nematophila]|uniref:Exported protein n=1 Tax=Xenorhabdus nematophila (strain ATCC 19061 / DSM 3370 / CCUG 14189 / LMG 1036 / NCIMB 9965 / AN6) TaxID=406817 RepID=D3VJ40_XENNA|nr:DUF305 domain-containing protein [Xenorhabdus nematophila]CEE91527.1 putative exported protein [Xenorhabdus nematophila str. Anatoliense]CEF32052.1 putative exported protein [Xenorhabdus nematophila str. Websteri]AYA39847.1 DUF305 domain-containing protein [Xenorhabdus nematophila]KHD29027.1 hypothetical protein LH67_06355 [Xenorhabdus nematophila]MBA0018413.1 DUF305 domain-containing protein [Xenorhabdus nematophila]